MDGWTDKRAAGRAGYAGLGGDGIVLVFERELWGRRFHLLEGFCCEATESDLLSVGGLGG